MKIKWEDKTNEFSDEERMYNDKYLEICNVYEEQVEVNLYSCDNGDFEIYVNYGIMFGISRTENKDGYLIFNQIKDDIAGEIAKNGFEPSPEFIDEFCEKYDITIPNDIFFNFNF